MIFVAGLHGVRSFSMGTFEIVIASGDSLVRRLSARLSGEYQDGQDVPPSGDEATERSADAVRPERAAARADRPGRAAPGRDRRREALSIRIPVLSGSRGFAPTVGRPWCWREAMSSTTCGCSSRTSRRRLGQAVEQVAEPVLTVEEVSRRYNVSPRTVTRWRRQGLVARRFVIDGRTKVGFLESSLQRFVTAHRMQVERGSRFRQLTEAERDEIIRRARRMALVRPGQAGLVEIARRIARKMARSTETVRLTLKTYDRDHPDRAIFPTSRAAARRRRQGPDLPALPHGRLGRGPGPPVRPDPVEHLPGHQRDAGPADPGHQARVHRPRELRRPGERRGDPRRRCPSRPTARRPGGPRPPRGCPLTWPASTRSRSWTASRRCTCSAR